MFKKNKTETRDNESLVISSSDTSLYTADYILGKALDIGEGLLKCGGEPNRIEDTVKRICSAYGAVHTDVFALPSLVMASVRMKDGSSADNMRRVYKTVNNMYRLDRINNLSRSICSGEISLEVIDETLEEILNSRPFNRYLSLIGGPIAAGAFAVFFGGSLFDGLAAAIAGFVVSALNLHKIKFGNQMLYTVAVSFFGAVTGLLVYKLGLGDNIDAIMIGTIMLVIPGLAFGNAIRDLLFGDTVSGIIQLVQAILTAVMVAFGFIVAIILFGGAGI